MDVREHIFTILKAFDIEPKPLDRLVEAHFKSHRGLASSERRIIADVVFEIMRWKRRIDGYLSLQGIKNPNRRQRVDWYLNCKDISGKEIPRDFPGGAAAFHSFPDFLYHKLVCIYGERKAEEVAAALNKSASPTLRINTLRLSREEVQKLLKSEGIETVETNQSPFGLKLTKRVGLKSLQVFKNGLIELQDESSQLAVIFADVKPGELVLDACAGGGGKSLMMAMLMQNKGKIVATDPRQIKLNELNKRAKRAGVRIIETVNTADFLKHSGLKRKFDLVFIDAPCSGTGTIRRTPDLKWRLNEKTIAEFAATQTKLLNEYMQWIRPNGRVVYATCSILAEENEEAVQKCCGSEKIDYFKTDPCLEDWDGFFAAKM